MMDTKILVYASTYKTVVDTHLSSLQLAIASGKNNLEQWFDQWTVLTGIKPTKTWFHPKAEKNKISMKLYLTNSCGWTVVEAIGLIYSE